MDVLSHLYYELDQSDQWILAHLGQSLDGRIATLDGRSSLVNGPENFDHLHKLRALADAVIVGAGTVIHDNPRLTVRRCEGENPTRVIIDTRGTLNSNFGVFHDGEAETIVATPLAQDKAQQIFGPGIGIITLQYREPELALKAIIKALHKRNLKRLFIEGGGITVSRFLSAGLLDRLQITIAPLILGSGKPAITLPIIYHTQEGLSPPCSTHQLGRDILFDFDLRSYHLLNREYGHPGNVEMSTIMP